MDGGEGWRPDAGPGWRLSRSPRIPGPSAYRNLVAAGLVDAWAALQTDDPGLTCCYPPDLLDADATLDRRIDHVLVRGLTPIRARLVGTDVDERTPTGLWPSDHAGLVAALGS